MTVNVEVCRKSYFADDTVAIDYENGAQVFSMTVPAAHADMVENLLPMCAYGENYRRGVADSLGTYYRILRRNGVGDAESAEYWLDQAMRAI